MGRAWRTGAVVVCLAVGGCWPSSGAHGDDDDDDGPVVEGVCEDVVDEAEDCYQAFCDDDGDVRFCECFESGYNLGAVGGVCECTEATFRDTFCGGYEGTVVTFRCGELVAGLEEALVTMCD